MKKFTKNIDNRELWKAFHLNSGIYSYNHEKTSTKNKLIFDGTKKISLLPSKINNSTELTEAIQNRSSQRNMSSAPISLDLLSKLLMNSYQFRNIDSRCKFEMLSPSAGGIYPIDIYLHCSLTVCKNGDFSAGLYYYNVLDKTIEQLTTQNCCAQIENIFLQKKIAKNSTIQIFFVASFLKGTQKYGERGYRFALIEAGHIAQNFNLIAHTIGLKAVNIGGYYEDKANELLKIDGLHSSTIYMLCIGF